MDGHPDGWHVKSSVKELPCAVSEGEIGSPVGNLEAQTGVARRKRFKKCLHFISS
jgi:hypothetical protein